MAQTTTAINACDVKIFLDDDAGTPVDISGSSNAVTIEFDNDLGEFRVFGFKWMNRLECGKDASFALEVIYTTAQDEGADLVKDWFFTEVPGRRTLTVYIPDKNVGSDRFQSEVLIDTWSAPSTAGEGAPIVMSVALLPDGEVTFSQAAT